MTVCMPSVFHWNLWINFVDSHSLYDTIWAYVARAPKKIPTFSCQRCSIGFNSNAFLVLLCAICMSMSLLWTREQGWLIVLPSHRILNHLCLCLYCHQWSACSNFSHTIKAICYCFFVATCLQNLIFEFSCVITLKTIMATTTADEPRIPLELQSIFLASNRGEEVHKPPKSAFRVFARRWIPRSPLRGRKNKKRLSKIQNNKNVAHGSRKKDEASSPFATATKRTHSSDQSEGFMSSSSSSSSSGQQDGAVVVSSSTPPPSPPQDDKIVRSSSPPPPHSPLSPRSSLSALRKMFSFQKMSTLTAGSSDLSEAEHVSRKESFANYSWLESPHSLCSHVFLLVLYCCSLV